MLSMYVCIDAISKNLGEEKLWIILFYMIFEKVIDIIKLNLSFRI